MSTLVELLSKSVFEFIWFGYNAIVLLFQWKPRHINRDTGPRTITEIRKEAADVSH